MMGNNQNDNRQQQDDDNKIFDSVDFGHFVVNNEPAIPSDLFLSKDNAIPSLDSVFKSKDSFSNTFKSYDWIMDYVKNEDNAGNEGPTELPPLKTESLSSEGEEQLPDSVLSSKDWMPMDVLGNHVDVSYNRDIFSGPASIPASPVTVPNEPSFSAGKTDWSAMMRSELQFPAPNAAASAVDNVRKTDDIPPTASAGPGPPKRKRKRRPRKKIVPDVKVYVEPTEHDVLLGRGGRSNHHPGNQRYRDEVKNLQRWYKGIEEKDEKTDLSQCLVDYVHNYQGRFLEKDTDGWYVVPNIVARRKASQALREDNDPEKRAAKRARFLKKKAAALEAKRIQEEQKQSG